MGMDEDHEEDGDDAHTESLMKKKILVVMMRRAQIMCLPQALRQAGCYGHFRHTLWSSQ